MDEVIRITMNFYYSHTLIAIGILVGLAVLLIIRPKQVLKTVGIIVALMVVGYILYLIYDAVFSGITGKREMIRKNP